MSISELDPNHWLYNDIAFAMWPADGVGDAHHDIKNGKTYNSIGTVSAGTRLVDGDGEYLEFSPAGSARSAAHEIALLKPPELALTSQISILVGYKRNGDQDTGWGRIISRTNGSTGDDWSITQENEVSGSKIMSRIDGNSIYGTSSMVIGEYHNIGMTYDQIRHKIFIDGVVEADVARTNVLPTDQNISIGVNPGSDFRNLYGDIYYLIIVNRGLSESEVATFTANPQGVLLAAASTTSEIESGSFSITGSNIDNLYNQKTELSSGAFNITGSDINVLHNRKVDIESGSFEITGSDISTLHDHLTVLESGSFILTGSTIDAIHNTLSPVAEIESGSFTLTGSDISTLHDHLTQLTSGAFTITGSDIDTVLSLVGSLESGAFVLTGSDINDLYNHLTTLESGAFTITGSDIAVTVISDADNIIDIRLIRVDNSFNLLQVVENKINLNRTTIPIQLERVTND